MTLNTKQKFSYSSQTLQKPLDKFSIHFCYENYCVAVIIKPVSLRYMAVAVKCWDILTGLLNKLQTSPLNYKMHSKFGLMWVDVY